MLRLSAHPCPPPLSPRNTLIHLKNATTLQQPSVLIIPPFLASVISPPHHSLLPPACYPHENATIRHISHGRHTGVLVGPPRSSSSLPKLHHLIILILPHLPIPFSASLYFLDDIDIHNVEEGFGRFEILMKKSYKNVATQ